LLPKPPDPSAQNPERRGHPAGRAIDRRSRRRQAPRGPARRECEPIGDLARTSEGRIHRAHPLRTLVDLRQQQEIGELLEQ
jgi:hypothetical protein